MTPEQMALFEAHKPLADAVARNFRIAGEGFESVQQDALMGLHKAVLTYDPERAAFEPFARTVINNHLRDFRRSLDHRNIELTILDEEPEGRYSHAWGVDFADPEPTPSHEVERNEIRSALQSGLAALTPGQREVLEHYAEGGTFAELARQKETTEQAVRQMFERGVQQIRPRLTERGMAGTQFMPVHRWLPVVPPAAARSEPTPAKQTRGRLGLLGTLAALLLLGVALLCLFYTISHLLRGGR